MFGFFKKKKLENSKFLRDDMAWLDGFNLGFSKAWDVMIPLMTEGVVKMKEAIREQAINDTLENLEPTVQKRIYEAGLHDLREVNDILAKKREFQSKLSSSKSEENKKKYENFIETLNWVLDGNISKKD